MTARAQCGTRAGHVSHAYRGEESCDRCRQAQREYTRRRRATRPDVRDSEAKAGAARTRALTRLARLYPEDYEALLRKERGLSAHEQGGEP